MDTPLHYLNCVELTYPHAITNSEADRLFREIINMKDQSIADSACEALVSHGHVVSKYVCELLRSDDSRVVDVILYTLIGDLIRPDQYSWDESVVQCAEMHISSDNQNIRAQAINVVALITHNPDEYASFLCTLAATETAPLRYVCTGALGSMNPIPRSCRPKLEMLLSIYKNDKEFVKDVKYRLCQLDHPDEECEMDMDD